MRDPEGALELRGDHVARQIGAGSPALAFLRSDAARALANAGKLVPFELRQNGELRAPRIAFVSQPHEWCDAQFAAAARHTLDLSRDLLAQRHELKDASAWNVIFDGRKPVFCDHLSPAPLREREWWAFGQFVRHFILPLAVSSVCGLRAYRAFQLRRDGLDAETARAIMGPRRFASRWWPLMLDLRGREAGRRRKPSGDIQRFREHVYRYCELNLPRATRRTGSLWSRYEHDRPHYSESAARHKRETVARWIEALRPSTVVDLGCNTGEFSRLAASAGARTVVAIDADHDAIERLHGAADAPANVFTAIADVADVPGGRGWVGAEAPGLFARLADRADVVMALALTHHLAIGESIPMREIARMLGSVSRSHAIVELIDERDPMVVELAAQRQRDPSEFAIALQRAALDEFFSVQDEVALPGTARALALLRRR
jgi:predicted RNA methylase